MKILLELEALSCISLEQEVGLPRGAITSLIIHSEGAVEIETSLDITATMQTKLKTALSKRGLPRGTKTEV